MTCANFPDHPLGDRVVHDINIILNDPEIKIVAEMMGGVHPAYDFSMAALKAGKNVVTSNKAVVADFGPELLAEARKHGSRYLFEASVGGGIPIIRALTEQTAGNDIYEIDGILNGTTNYILTEMLKNGTSFDDALSSARSSDMRRLTRRRTLTALMPAERYASSPQLPSESSSRLRRYRQRVSEKSRPTT